MDEEFERRWRAGLPPFDGVTLYQEDVIPLSVLRPVLVRIVECLAARAGDADLQKVDDWHEHDGYVAPSKHSSWQELQSILASEPALRASSTRETFVSTGFFPASRTFYLRIYIPDDYDLPAECTEPQGRFDLTCDAVWAQEILKIVSATPSVAIRVEPAKPFFDRNWAG